MLLPATCRRELQAARLLAESGFNDAAVSRAYYAALGAARAAVESAGSDPSTHAGLIREFGRIAVVDGGFDPETAGILKDLFGKRSFADYELLASSSEEAGHAIAKAERFVDAVERWLGAR